MFFRVISGGGFAGWVVLGARVGVVRVVGAVLWRGSGCGGARGQSFGGGWGRRAVVASMGCRVGRRAVVVVWRATSAAGAGSIFLRSALFGRVRAIVAI